MVSSNPFAVLDAESASDTDTQPEFGSEMTAVIQHTRSSGMDDSDGDSDGESDDVVNMSNNDFVNQLSTMLGFFATEDSIVDGEHDGGESGEESNPSTDVDAATRAYIGHLIEIETTNCSQADKDRLRASLGNLLVALQPFWTIANFETTDPTSDATVPDVMNSNSMTHTDQ
jgi:hypothetical protein